MSKFYEKSPPGWKKTVEAMKKYKNITNPFALAWWMKKKGDKPHYPKKTKFKEFLEMVEPQNPANLINDLVDKLSQEQMMEFTLYLLNDCYAKLNSKMQSVGSKVIILIKRWLKETNAFTKLDFTQEISDIMNSLRFAHADISTNIVNGAINTLIYINSLAAKTFILSNVFSIVALFGENMQLKLKQYINKIKSYLDIDVVPMDSNPKLQHYLDKIRKFLDLNPELQDPDLYQALTDIGENNEIVIEMALDRLEKFLNNYLTNNKRFIVDYPNKDKIDEYNKLKVIVYAIEHILHYMLDLQVGNDTSDHLFGLLDKLLKFDI